MRRTQKKSELQRSANYKNLLNQYYDKDPQLSDAGQKLKPIFPEIQILSTLSQFEKKLDDIIKMKRYDVQQMFVKPVQKLKRVLRVYVMYEKKEAEDILKIFGHLYPPSQRNTTVLALPKFTSFFKQISFFLSGQTQPFENWKKPTTNYSQQDGFLLRLPKSNEQSSINIKLCLINNPPKYQVESTLQRIVGLKRGTRIAILNSLWQYIKQNKLQDIENKEIINCDEKLKSTLKTDKFAFATVNSRIRELLLPLESVAIQIKPTESQKVYDFIVEIEERPDVDIVPFFSQKLNEQKNEHPFLSLNGKIKKYEKKFYDHSQKLRRHLAKKQIYQNFIPESIENIVMEQNELLKILKEEKSIENFNKIEFVLDNEEEVEKEIKHYYEQLNSNPFSTKQ